MEMNNTAESRRKGAGGREATSLNKNFGIGGVWENSRMPDFGVVL